MLTRGVVGRLVIAADFNEVTVFQRETQEKDVIRALTLRFVHQLIRALNEIGGQAPGDEPPVRNPSQPETDDAAEPERRIDDDDDDLVPK